MQAFICKFISVKFQMDVAWTIQRNLQYNLKFTLNPANGLIYDFQTIQQFIVFRNILRNNFDTSMSSLIGIAAVIRIMQALELCTSASKGTSENS